MSKKTNSSQILHKMLIIIHSLFQFLNLVWKLASFGVARLMERRFLAKLPGYKVHHKNRSPGTCLMVQWLRLCTPNAGGLGSIPGQGTRSHTTTKTQHS